jgi:FAD synthase
MHLIFVCFQMFGLILATTFEDWQGAVLLVGYTNKLPLRNKERRSQEIAKYRDFCFVCLGIKEQPSIFLFSEYWDYDLLYLCLRLDSLSNFLCDLLVGVAFVKFRDDIRASYFHLFNFRKKIRKRRVGVDGSIGCGKKDKQGSQKKKRKLLQYPILKWTLYSC